VWQVLESAKDLFLGVDPPGQHVPPRVRYGMTCLVIRKLRVCVLFEINGEGGYVCCLRSMGKGMAIPGIHLVQEGPKKGKP
jgi:hypothetical protein